VKKPSAEFTNTKRQTVKDKKTPPDALTPAESPSAINRAGALRPLLRTAYFCWPSLVPWASLWLDPIMAVH